MSGLGGLSGFWFLDFGTGLAFGDGVGDLVRPGWRIKRNVNKKWVQLLPHMSLNHTLNPSPHCPTLFLGIAMAILDNYQDVDYDDVIMIVGKYYNN